MTLGEGERIRSADGYGGLGPNLGIFRARCQAGPTVFLAQAREREVTADLRTLLPVTSRPRPPASAAAHRSWNCRSRAGAADTHPADGP
jgi:hypothetical protein